MQQVQTVVGINAWVSHQDKSVFGADADLFRPERWLGSKEEVAPLERNLFSVSTILWRLSWSYPLNFFLLT